MDKYIAIDRSSLIGNTILECDLYIKNIVNGVPRYVLYTCKGERICNDRREELIHKNIRKLFVTAKDFSVFYKYQENNLKIILDDNERSYHEKSTMVYKVAKYIVQDVLNDPKSGNNNIERVNSWVDSTVRYIIHDKNAFSSLFSVTTHDYYTYTHSINTSVYSLLFSKHLELSPYDINNLGIGMVLHDLGKVEIPPEILDKPSNLTKEEFEVVKKHPESGLKLLEEKKDLSEEALKVVIQHHENCDGTGYPYGIGSKELHLNGKISRIVDVYDALTTRRIYRTASQPFPTLVEMKEIMHNCFDTELLNEFVQLLGPFEKRKNQRDADVLY